MHVQPYLFFDGRCEEAVEFYRTALGADIEMLMRFKDAPEPPDGQEQAGGCMPPEAAGDKVMHASFRVGDTVIMASDGMCQGKPSFQGFALSVSLPVEDADRRFAALAEGGQVQMPLGQTFFSPRFGMLADRFGVNWMIHVAP